MCRWDRQCLDAQHQRNNEARLLSAFPLSFNIVSFLIRSETPVDANS